MEDHSIRVTVRQFAIIERKETNSSGRFKQISDVTYNPSQPLVPDNQQARDQTIVSPKAFLPIE